MITRFYVDNYKCLQNFEYKPQQLELIVGANGTGKTTVFEALDKVRRFVTGQSSAKELFPASCATRWSLNSQQIFELDFIFNGEEYQYRLEIGLASTYRVEKEILKTNGDIFCETSWERQSSQEHTQVNLFQTEDGFDDSDPFADDDHKNDVRFLQFAHSNYKMFLSDPNQSAFSRNTLKYGLLDIHFLKINPAIMTSQVRRAESRPVNDLSNFASYYLFLLQQRQGQMFEMIPHLREAITDFDSFAVKEDFEEGRRDLQVVCLRPSAKRGSSEPLRYGFEEMSDGQRALIALYTLLFCTLEAGSTLIIDEPENYVALRELQPWLMLLQDRLEEQGGQVILISHHPEFINALAPGHTTVFERENNGPVRIKPFNAQMAATLTPAEVMARGWENE